MRSVSCCGLNLLPGWFDHPYRRRRQLVSIVDVGLWTRDRLLRSKDSTTISKHVIWERTNTIP